VRYDLSDGCIIRFGSVRFRFVMVPAFKQWLDSRLMPSPPPMPHPPPPPAASGAVFELERLRAEDACSTVAQLTETIRVKDSELQRHVADKKANAALLTVKDNTITSLKQDNAAHRTRIVKLEQQIATLERERLTDERLRQCGSAAEIECLMGRADEEMGRLAGFKRRAEALHDEKRREEEESDRMCLACKGREKTVTLPCGHVCYCRECYRRILLGPPERPADGDGNGDDEDEEMAEEPVPPRCFCKTPFYDVLPTFSNDGDYVLTRPPPRGVRTAYMRVRIKESPTGRQVPLWVRRESLVLHVKAALYHDISKIHLIFGGKTISDELLLAEYGVLGGSTIHMIVTRW